MKRTLELFCILISTFTALGAVAAPVCHSIHASVPTFEQITNRIDALIALGLRLQTRNFANHERLQQSLAYYDAEREKLSQTLPDFESLYRQRFQVLSPDIKRKLKSEKNRDRERQKRRTSKIRSVETLALNEFFRIPHTGAVKTTFSPNGKFVATASLDKVANILNLETGRITSLQMTYALNKIEFTPDSRLLVIRDLHNFIHIVDAPTGQILKTLDLNILNAVLRISYTADSRFMVIDRSDNQRLIVDLTSLEIIASLPMTISFAGSSISPDGKFILSSPDTYTIQAHDILTRDVVYTSRHDRPLIKYQISPDSRYLITASSYHLKVLDLTTGNLKIDRQYSIRSESTDLSPDSRFAATTRSDHSLVIFDSLTEKALSYQHANVILSLQFSPDGKFLATRSLDQTAKLIDLASGRELTFPGQKFTPSLFFSPDSKHLVAYTAENVLAITKMPSNEPVRTLTFQDSVSEIKFSPDGKLLLVTLTNNTFKIIQVEDGEILLEGSAPTGFTHSFIFSPDSHRLMMTTNDNMVLGYQLYRGIED